MIDYGGGARPVKVWVPVCLSIRGAFEHRWYGRGPVSYTLSGPLVVWDRGQQQAAWGSSALLAQHDAAASWTVFSVFGLVPKVSESARTV